MSASMLKFQYVAGPSLVDLHAFVIDGEVWKLSGVDEIKV